MGEPPAHDTVQVSGPLDLRRVAEWTGSPVDVIQQMNPELRRWTTPVRGTGYGLKVPAGTADEIRARLDGLPASERAALNWHTVKSGETLLTISRKLRVSRTDLAEANYLSVRSRVRPGEKLIIPLAPTTLMASQPERTTPTRGRVASGRGARGARDVERVERHGAPHLSRAARRHAVVDREDVRDQRQLAEAVESPARHPDQPGPAADGLHAVRSIRRRGWQFLPAKPPTRRAESAYCAAWSR